MRLGVSSGLVFGPMWMSLGSLSLMPAASFNQAYWSLPIFDEPKNNRRRANDSNDSHERRRMFLSSNN